MRSIGFPLAKSDRIRLSFQINVCELMYSCHLWRYIISPPSPSLLWSRGPKRYLSRKRRVKWSSSPIVRVALSRSTAAMARCTTMQMVGCHASAFYRVQRASGRSRGVSLSSVIVSVSSKKPNQAHLNSAPSLTTWIASATTQPHDRSGYRFWFARRE